MKKYEIGFIMQPNMNDAEKNETIDKMKSIYTSLGCEIIDEENVGMRELAYEIQKHTTGHYFYFLAKANTEANLEFERIARIDENIIRFLVVNINDVAENTLEYLRKQSK